MVKVLLIDFAFTISKSRFWEQFKTNRYKKLYLSLGGWFASEESTPIVHKWNTGQLSSTEVCELLALKFNVGSDFLYQELVKSCTSMKFINPKVPNALTKLKKEGFQLVLATDHIDLMRSHILNALEIYDLFDELLISCEIGKVKLDGSDDKFFKNFLNKNQININQTLLIDDNALIISKYSNLGYKCIHVTESNDLVAICDNVYKGIYES